MSTNLGECVHKLEDAYFLLEKTGIDPIVQRSLATSLFIYAIQAGPGPRDHVLNIIRGVIPDEEIAEVEEDQEFEHGDYYLLLPLSFALRALETISSNDLFQGINLLIETANCLNEENTYELYLKDKNPLEDDKLFLNLLKTFMKIQHRLFTDEEEITLTPDEVLEITKVLGVKNSLTHVATLKHAARIANSVQQDDNIPLEDKADIFIMALKSMLSSDENMQLAVVYAKMKQYEFAKNF